MKVAFSGTHIVGKTTLLMQYKEHLAATKGRDFVNLGYITGVARSIISRGFPLGKDGNIYSYINYINDQLKEEEGMGNYDVFISDRTLLSVFAYSSVNVSIPRPYIPDYFIEMVERIWLLEKEHYDLYIYFPIEFPALKQDRFHQLDEEYRAKVDAKIHETLEKHNVNHYHMTGSREIRLRKLINILHGQTRN